jgi:hypothetical protein
MDEWLLSHRWEMKMIRSRMEVLTFGTPSFASGYQQLRSLIYLKIKVISIQTTLYSFQMAILWFVVGLWAIESRTRNGTWRR